MAKDWVLFPKISKDVQCHHFNSVLYRSLRWCNDARQTNRIHRNQEELKLSLFADDVIFCRENPKDLTKKLVSNLNKVTEYKSFDKNQSYFYMLVMNLCNLKLYLCHSKTNRWKRKKWQLSPYKRLLLNSQTYGQPTWTTQQL